MRKIRLLLILLGLMCTPCFANEQAVQMLNVKGANHWIVEPESGRIFVSLPKYVREFDAQGNKVRDFYLDGGNPDELLIKNNYLVVSVPSDGDITTIDLNTNEIKDHISVGRTSKGPYGLFCSKADNSYIYCLMDNTAIIQIDLEIMDIRNRSTIRGWGQSSPIHVAMSADGKWIVPDARGKISPSGADLMAVDEENFKFTQIRDHHRSYGQMVAGPANRYWTFGKKLYPLDIEKETELHQYQGEPVAIHPELDLVASYSSTGLHFEVFSTRKAAGHVGLKNIPTHKLKRRSTWDKRRDPTLQFDLKNQCVFLGHGDTAWIVDLAKAGISAKPVLRMIAPSNSSLVVNETWSLPLRVSAKSPTPTFKLLYGPKNLKITKDTLQWTPQVEDLGPHKIMVQAQSGSSKDTLALNLIVTLPSMYLPYMVHGTAVSKDEKLLIIRGRPTEQSGDGETISTIDLETLQILSSVTTDFETQWMYVTEKYIFLVPKSGSSITRLPIDRLHEKKSFTLHSKVQKMSVIGPEHIAMSFMHTAKPVVKYNTHTMQPVSWLGSELDLDYKRLNANKRFQLSGDRLRIGERVFDINSGELVGLSDQYKLPKLKNSSYRSSRYTNQRWARSLSRGTLRMHDSQISRIDVLSTLSHRWPVAISVSSDTRNSYRNVIKKRILKIHDLVEGKALKSYTLEVAARRIQKNNLFLELAGDKAVFISQNKLIVSKLPVEMLEKVVPPLQLKPPPSLVIAKADKPLKIQLETLGAGSKDFTSNNRLYTSIVDSKLIIDAPATWKDMLKRVEDSARRDSFKIKSEIESNAQKYMTLLGKPLRQNSYAMTLPVNVTVTGEAKQSDHLDFEVVIVGKRSEVEHALAAPQRDRQAMAERREKELKQRQARKDAANRLKRQTMHTFLSIVLGVACLFLSLLIMPFIPSFNSKDYTQQVTAWTVRRKPMTVIFSLETVDDKYMQKLVAYLQKLIEQTAEDRLLEKHNAGGTGAMATLLRIITDKSERTGNFYVLPFELTKGKTIYCTNLPNKRFKGKGVQPRYLCQLHEGSFRTLQLCKDEHQ